MAEKTQTFSRNLPKEGIEITASPGKGLTRVHLDLSHDGISLAMVGAASAALASGNRQKIILTPGKEGISLAMVGAATARK